MKKVAIFINNLMGGGAERIVSYLLNEGHERFEMHLILLESKIAYQIPDDKIKMYKLEGASNSVFSTILHLKKQAANLQKYLEENKIDTLLSLLNRCNLLACRVKKNGWKGKLIISERADTLAHYHTVRFGWYMLRLVKKYYPYADEVTVISKGIAKSLAKLGIPDAKVIYNPNYGGKSESPEVRKTERREKGFTFINIARLESQKNQELLIRAFTKTDFKNSELIILGIGPLEEKLKQLAKKLGVKDFIRFEGFQKNVDEWLEKADCFVFSSDYEGLGNVIIEALNAGLPVISTDCPSGPREILSPSSEAGIYEKDKIDFAEFGLLTPVKNDVLLAGAMQKIKEDKDLRNRYKKTAKKRSLDFELKKTMEEYFSLF